MPLYELSTELGTIFPRKELPKAMRKTQLTIMKNRGSNKEKEKLKTYSESSSY